MKYLRRYIHRVIFCGIADLIGFFLTHAGIQTVVNPIFRHLPPVLRFLKLRSIIFRIRYNVLSIFLVNTVNPLMTHLIE